ncbi:lysophospholipid acyltransferase family protein [Lutimaribacter sp. EGI FJ00015]|uniref:Lysophospholipid acyltransferase family protein n=1 Tax=Lutimaribacter degradans TaxID=2945989 RepID=A0ACC5ZSR4_9RHOB|nr:lysophospholipid acyltransferase family protein [Lutimaribacter sp. EGI FJ00013]MCM2560988.1 lysophospholipid acyltransferase family protein [Lutimaribacter sp. EGI FJ00013]MCO0612065.1 lysophospholipid acyltransferase family protein [Lutimaribacter sp. EGI FJ00015]MCO0634815.1 lysophospholipid acyltransferase family protein [Lutimaribacter sp. EGI FJ00014]
MRLRYFVTNLALRGFFGLALALPYNRRVPLMGWLAARVIAPLAGWRRRVRDNLAHVRPDLPRAEVSRLARAVPNNAGRTLIEIYSGEEFVTRAARAPIEGPGLQALEDARATGRPVILVTAHFGNYDVARAALIARGHDMGSLYRRMRNPYFNAHYVRSISAIGTPMFEQGRRGMVQMVKHLKAGGVLGVLTDLHVYEAPELIFFGKPARTSLVTAELALKYDALLIPTFSIRQPNGLDFIVRLEAPIPHSDARTMTQEVNDRLEALVRAHMDQWFWIHRRWKNAGDTAP